MSTLKVDTITDTTGLLPPVFPAGSAQLNPLANREDRIINGDFGVWQRGTTGTNQVYVADRWANFSSGGTITNSRQAFALGDTLGANQPAFFLRATVSGQSATNSAAYISQRVEGVRSYAGQTVTVLGWARRSSGAGNIVFEGYQNFGTGGSFSAAVNTLGVTTIPLTDTWAPFAAVVTFPTIATKTIGTGGDDHVGFVFWAGAGSDYNARTNSLGLQTIGVDFWGIHIRQGTWTAAATADYRPRDPGTELELCRRYFRLNPTLQGSMNIGNTAFIAQGFGGDMRANPTITVRTATAVIHWPSQAFYNISSVVSASVSYVTLIPSTLFGANYAGQLLGGCLNADAEL